MRNFYIRALDLIGQNGDLALATIVSVSGSTPQKQGCSAVIGMQGIISGTVGGGTIENQVTEIARKNLRNRKSGLYNFQLGNDIHHEEEAICGGTMSILIDADLSRHLDTFGHLAETLSTGSQGTLITKVNAGENDQVMVTRQWSAGFNEFREFTRAGEGRSFILYEPVMPPSRILIAGAGHIGKALAHLVNLLDFEVTVMDDRPEFANEKNIPDADHILTGDFEKSIRESAISGNTYIVIVTRGHKNDADALKNCIGSPASYIGMIGSKRKIALMREKFLQQGWATEQQWDRIHAPVGIDIGSRSVQEIAVSIAAELIRVRNSKKDEHA